MNIKQVLRRLLGSKSIAPAAEPSTDRPPATRSDEAKEQHASPAVAKSTRVELPAEKAARQLIEHEQQTATDPQNPQGWFGKAEALAVLKRPAEALTAYQQTLALESRHPLALRGKAYALRELGQRDAALETIDRSLEIDPNIAVSWRTKGAILRDFGRHEEALSCYEKGLSIDPKDATLWCNRGNALRALHRIDEAMQSYHQASAGHPIATLDEGVRDARDASMRLWKAMNVGEHLVMRLWREFRIGQTWDTAEPEPPAQADGERLKVTVRSVTDLKAWLALYGFELRKEASGSTTLVGPGGEEHIDHFKTSLWLESCRLGDWGTNDDQDAWFILEPASDDTETQTRQRNGWRRLTELLASGAMNHLPTTLARALAMEEVHKQRLLAQKGHRIRNFNACAACGTALYADSYGGSSDHYRIKLENPERQLILCMTCGKQLQGETTIKGDG